VVTHKFSYTFSIGLKEQQWRLAGTNFEIMAQQNPVCMKTVSRMVSHPLPFNRGRTISIR